MATEPTPVADAAVPRGETQSVTVADGLNTYSPSRWALMLATCTLALLTVGGESAFGLG